MTQLPTRPPVEGSVLKNLSLLIRPSDRAPAAGKLRRRVCVGWRRLSVAFLAWACVSALVPEVRCQQPASPGESEAAELRRRVEMLEFRMRKVEEVLRAAALGRAAATSKQPASPEPEVAQENDATVPAPAPPATPAPSEPATMPAPTGAPARAEDGLLNFFKQTEVSGFIDTYYGYNRNRPFDRHNQLRFFDTQHNQFAFNLAQVVFEKKPDAERSRIGFRFDLGFGPEADLLSSFEPGNRETYKHVLQAYGSYLAPIGKGLRLDVGKISSPAGAEYKEALENWNYTRGLLYTFGTPGYHAGVLFNYEFNSQVGLRGGVVNGWNNIEDNNGGKSLFVSVTVNPTSKLSFTQNYIGGPEQTDDDRHQRRLFDTVVTYDFNERWALMGEYLYGFDTLSDESKVRWQGASAYLRYAPTKRLAFSPRFEWFADYDGFTTGTAQRLKELTFTSEFKLNQNFLTRLEYRREWSNKFVFHRSDPNVLSRHQPTVLAGLIWSFNTAHKSETHSTTQPGSRPAPTPAPTPAEAPQLFLNAQAQSPLLLTNGTRRAAVKDELSPLPTRLARPEIISPPLDTWRDSTVIFIFTSTITVSDTLPPARTVRGPPPP